MLGNVTDVSWAYNIYEFIVFHKDPSNKILRKTIFM